MAFEDFKPKYLFNLGKQITKINKTYIIKAIWTIFHRKKEEEKQNIFFRFSPAGIEPTHLPDKGLPC